MPPPLLLLLLPLLLLGTRVLLLSSAHVVLTSGQQSVSLDGKWRLENSNGSLSLPAGVPGCVHTALLQQGVIQVTRARMHTHTRARTQRRVHTESDAPLSV